MVREHLRKGPVQVERAALRESHRRLSSISHTCRAQPHFHGDGQTTKRAVGRIVEIGEWLRVTLCARGERRAKGRQRFERHHPRTDRACKILGEKRAQWLILPALDIARRPVVQETNAKEVIVGVVYCDRFALCVAATDESTQLQFVVE